MIPPNGAVVRGEMVPAPEAPAEIVLESRYLWGRRQWHVITTRMRLVDRTLSGPQYALVAVISDVGAPPVGARKPPTCAGFSWAGLAEGIASRRVIVVGAKS